MRWKDHSRLEGLHAPFPASGYSWIHYDDEHAAAAFKNMLAKAKGTEDHEFAATCIKRRQKIHKSPDPNLANYVNDAIGFRMSPEVLLYYSDNFFGTTDAICFRPHPDKKSNYKWLLRIHDLKTGVTKAKLDQLYIYAALFFLEYEVNPLETEIVCRIYQYGDILEGNPTSKEIRPIMDQIIRLDKVVEEIKSSEE